MNTSTSIGKCFVYTTAMCAVGILSSSIEATEVKDIAPKMYWSEYEGSGSNHIIDLSNRESEGENFSDMVSKTINILGLPITDMEKVFKVTRATIYSWKNGTTPPNDGNMTQINHYHGIAKFIEDSIEHRYGRYAKTFNFKGTSFLEKLIEHSTAKEIREHCLALNKVLESRKSLITSTKKKNNLDSDDIHIIS